MLHYGNGNVYRGEFMQGQRAGTGMIQIHAIGTPDDHNIRTPVPGVYIGEFREERLNGHGLILMPSAAFMGQFNDNLFAPPASAASR